MDIVIEQSCPSCGAPIVLHEADRLIGCPYCEVKNYMIAGGPARFVLPDKLPQRIEREDLVYVPYLRFKGSIYSCQGYGIQHAVIDTTRLAIAANRLPASLGLRPQAMKVIPANADHLGHFVRQTVAPETLFAQAAKLTSLSAGEKKHELYHRAFIGETLSRIYLPLYHWENSLYDAVTNLEIGRVGSSWPGLIERTVPFQKSWEPRFLSTLCPRCASPMAGEADALALHCPNCQTMWVESEGRFAAIDWENISGESDENLAIPFWKITLSEGQGGELGSFADFLRFTNQPVLVKREYESLPLSFWIPAFKVTPAIFLQTAHYLTVSQRRLPEGEMETLSRAYPVNLSSQEAVQSLKCVVAEAALTKKTVLPLLPSLSLAPGKISLVYLPFRDTGHDLIQVHTQVSIASAALRFGRKL